MKNYVSLVWKWTLDNPKKMDKTEISRKYRACLEYGKENCPHLIKTGWDAING